MNWWLFQEPNDTTSGCGYQRIDNTDLQYDEIDEPARCGFDSIFNNTPVKVVQKPISRISPTKKAKSSRIRIKKLSSKKPSLLKIERNQPRVVKKPVYQKPKRKLRVKQHPIGSPKPKISEAEKAENKVINGKIKDYLLREENKEKEFQEFILKIEREEKEAQERRERLSKISKFPLTYDHRGEPMAIKTQGNKPFDLDSSRTLVNPPPEPIFEDLGITQTQNIFKIQ